MGDGVAAILLAAGSSRRMGGEDKLWADLGGRPVVAHALATFASVEDVGTLAVVAPAARHAEIRALFKRARSSPLRSSSSRVARDGATPLVRASRPSPTPVGTSCTMPRGRSPAPALARRVLEAARGIGAEGAAVPGVPVVDTIKRVDAEGRVVETPPRESLRAAQTPQAFAGDLLRRAHAATDDDATDDAALVERLGVPVLVVEGEAANLKVTTPADLETARRLLDTLARRGAPPMRVGNGYDIHRFKDDGTLRLGGMDIPGAPQLDGHSDGDALIHAIIDALLGAAGEGDIGQHFPPGDPSTRGIDSRELLQRVSRLIARDGLPRPEHRLDGHRRAAAPRAAPVGHARLDRERPRREAQRRERKSDHERGPRCARQRRGDRRAGRRADRLTGRGCTMRIRIAVRAATRPRTYRGVDGRPMTHLSHLTAAVCACRRGVPHTRVAPPSRISPARTAPHAALREPTMGWPPAIERIREDIATARQRDPAARSTLEVLLTYPGIHALIIHRVSRRLALAEVPLLPRLVSHFGRLFTGIEIHPRATIGRRLFIDHGMGVVIGETTRSARTVTSTRA